LVQLRFTGGTTHFGFSFTISSTEGIETDLVKPLDTIMSLFFFVIFLLCYFSFFFIRSFSFSENELNLENL